MNARSTLVRLFLSTVHFELNGPGVGFLVTSLAGRKVRGLGFRLILSLRSQVQSTVLSVGLRSLYRGGRRFYDRGASLPIWELCTVPGRNEHTHRAQYYPHPYTA